MKLVLSILLVFVYVNCAVGLSDEFVRHLWKNYKHAHGKHYLGAELDDFRYSIFKNNLEIIDKHNEEYHKGLYTYRLGMNVFADWTVEEFRETMLGTKLNMTQRHQAILGTFLPLPPHIELPESVDWRESGAVTPVKNQGQCGSCWAFSTTGSMEGAHFRLTNELISLSEQQLVDCSSHYDNNGCNGGLMDNAFKYIKENGGLETEEAYPYRGREGRCKFVRSKALATCSGFIDIPTGDEQSLKEAVGTVGPVSVAIDVTEEKFMLYKDGVFVDETCRNTEDDLNHGVLVVGYGTSFNDENEPMDYWIVKNSWGPGWGEGGYIRMARNMENMCGVSTSASYPLVKEAPRPRARRFNLF